MTLNCIHIFIVTSSFLYWCVMRPANLCWCAVKQSINQLLSTMIGLTRCVDDRWQPETVADPGSHLPVRILWLSKADNHFVFVYFALTNSVNRSPLNKRVRTFLALVVLYVYFAITSSSTFIFSGLWVGASTHSTGSAGTNLPICVDVSLNNNRSINHWSQSKDAVGTVCAENIFVLYFWIFY